MTVGRVKAVVLASPGPPVADAVTLVADRLAVARDGRIVVAEVSFRLGPGEALLVTGRNGAGKSTLLRCLAGLLPPAAGHINLEGADAPDARAERLHYLGHANGLKRSLTVAENLRLAAALLGAEGGATPAAALAAQGLERLADLPAGVLSAGQRRRVALARLLVAPRPIWLLDEPATALDAAAQALLVDVLAAHRTAGGVAVIATHDALALPGASELTLDPAT